MTCIRNLRRAWLVYALGALTAGAAAVQEPAASVEGTWSGMWETSPATEEPATITFRLDPDGHLEGKLVDPGGLELDRLSFDPATGSLTAGCGSEESVEATTACALTATVSGTRLEGRLTYEGSSGILKLVKWTFTPPPRGSIIVD
jgi:hypothetical protein